MATTRQTNRDEVTAERTKVASDLKDVVAKYVKQYADLTAKIKTESDATLNKEFQNIKTKVR